MSKPAMRLVDAAVSPPRTPERAELAAAQERHADAVRQLAANESAQQTTTEAIYAARDTVKAATAAIEEAKANAATHLTAVAMGNAGPAPTSVKAARVALQDAEDALEAALAARAELEQQHKDAEHEIEYAGMALGNAVANVVRDAPELRKLAADHAAADRHYHDLHFAMEAVQSFLPDDLKYWHGTGRWPDLAAAATWKAALQELRENADVPLPTS